MTHLDTFSVLRNVVTSVNNKPVTGLQSVAQVSGEIFEKMYQIMDSNQVVTDTVESEIFIPDLFFQFNLDDQLRQISNNQRWRIVKIFYRIQRTCLWVARSTGAN